MGRVQKNPYKFLYEPKTFDGIPAIGIGANLDHSLIPKDFFCYDICQSDMENTSGFLSHSWEVPPSPSESIHSVAFHSFPG